jgi:hypothetical protein
LADVTHKELVEHLAAVVVADYQKSEPCGSSNAVDIVKNWMVNGHGKATVMVSFDTGEWF